LEIPKKPDIGSDADVNGRASNLAPVEMTLRCIGH